MFTVPLLGGQPLNLSRYTRTKFSSRETRSVAAQILTEYHIYKHCTLLTCKNARYNLFIFFRIHRKHATTSKFPFATNKTPPYTFLSSKTSSTTSIKFVYLNRAKRQLKFRPYDLERVKRGEQEPEHFFISATGVRLSFFSQNHLRSGCPRRTKHAF